MTKDKGEEMTDEKENEINEIFSSSFVCHERKEETHETEMRNEI